MILNLMFHSQCNNTCAGCQSPVCCMTWVEFALIFFWWQSFGSQSYRNTSNPLLLYINMTSLRARASSPLLSFICPFLYCVLSYTASFCVCFFSTMNAHVPFLIVSKPTTWCVYNLCTVWGCHILPCMYKQTAYIAFLIASEPAT